MNVLVINAGSSSLKYQLIDVETQEVLAKGLCERVGSEDAVHTYGLSGNKHTDEVPISNHTAAMGLALAAITSGPTKAVDSLDEIDAVGHRIVQGGSYFDRSCLVTDEVKDKIAELAALAPLHNRAALAGIEACEAQMPGKPMVAVFDTSFFQTLAPDAFMYPLPYELYERYAIRKYGAHGTSHRYVSQRSAEFLGEDAKNLRIITCHLGNGCSISAIKGGIAIDTSMGLTPLDGLMMGTRCGSIDPAIVPFVMEHDDLTPAEMDTLMNKQSGLLGISGVSNDMRTVDEAAAAGNERAALANEMFARSAKKFIGQYIAVLGGVDVIAFTAGIGENSDVMRAKILEGLEELGISVDPERNDGVRGVECEISPEDAPVRVLVIPTNEEYMIARDTYDVVCGLSA